MKIGDLVLFKDKIYVVRKNYGTCTSLYQMGKSHMVGNEHLKLISKK